MAYRTGTGEEASSPRCSSTTRADLRLQVARYEHNLEPGRHRRTPPLDQIEAFANQPTNAVFLVQTMDAPAAGTLPRFLPGVRQPGRKPNDFYGWVLIHKRACEERGDSYAHRITGEALNSGRAGIVIVVARSTMTRSTLKKKCALSRTTGPPILARYVCSCVSGLVSPFCLTK